MILLRKYTLNRWNWSDKANKWVYVKKKGGKRVYEYKAEAPTEFEECILEIHEINQKLLIEPDFAKQDALYRELMKISQRMQAMKS